MVECELCKALEYSKDYSFVSRLCRGCLVTKLAEWVELFNQKQSQWVDAKKKNAKLIRALREAIQVQCVSCTNLQKLLDETENNDG